MLTADMTDADEFCHVVSIRECESRRIASNVLAVRDTTILPSLKIASFVY